MSVKVSGYITRNTVDFSNCQFVYLCLLFTKGIIITVVVGNIVLKIGATKKWRCILIIVLFLSVDTWMQASWMC
jgi:hypothetical protein